MTREQQATRLAELLNSAGFSARPWQGGDKVRVYLNGGLGKDIKAFFNIATEDERSGEAAEEMTVTNALQGTSLKVYSDAAQDQQWLINRAKQVKRGIAVRLFENGFLADKPPEDWREMSL